MKIQFLSQKGAVFVEFVISILLFMFIMVLVIDLLRFGYLTVTAQHIVNESIRHAAISKFDDDICTGIVIDKDARLKCIKDQTVKVANNFSYTINATDVIVKVLTDFPAASNVEDTACSSSGTQRAGTKNEFVVICVVKPDVLMFLGLSTNLRAFSVARVEPYDLST